ncbi:MAG: BrnT family toxin [Dehalococcoidia bacterium]|nr:BrnT family toxin [Dehalococcoidia bacterium]
MRIFELIVEPGSEDHIARHHVSVEEVEQVVFGGHLTYRTRQGRYRFIGQTAAGRYLAIIVAPREHGVYGLVTARDADQGERRLYQRQRRN